MEQEKNENFLIDRGGRRQIKDRRFRVTPRQTPEHRTGLKRRIGWDRRYKHIHLIKGTDRREE